MGEQCLVKTMPNQDLLREIETNIRRDYVQYLDDNQKFLDRIQKFIILAKEGAELKELLKEAILTIQWVSSFREATITLRSKDDGLFRYVEMAGFTHEAEMALKRVSYAYNDVFDMKSYPAVTISKYTRLFLAETKPYKEGEEGTYNRPSMRNNSRTSHDELMEGDYFEINMFGIKGELLGWIELSGTKDSRMPSMQSLKWLEHLSIVLSSFIQQNNE